MNQREAIFEGTKQATRLHEVLGTKDHVMRSGGRVDVFEAITHQGSTLIFRDIKGIIGAYLNENGSPGIMVTTQRPLAVQRFTAAHELGHFYMGHDPSVDGDEILKGSESLASVEVQANAFAAEFLAPKWLLIQHGIKQGWNADSLKDPVLVYQLSLRLGLSYEATCVTLKSQRLISDGVLQSLNSMTPKKIKCQLLSGAYEPEHWYQDVWLLTERDQGMRISNQPEDLFVFWLKEGNGAGCYWDTKALSESGFTILADERLPQDMTRVVGGPGMRRISVGPVPREKGVFLLMGGHSREGRTAGTELMIPYVMCGKEKGLLQMLRSQILAGEGWY